MTVLDFEVFWFMSNSPLAVKGPALHFQMAAQNCFEQKLTGMWWCEAKANDTVETFWER